MICRVLGTRQKAAKNASSRTIYYLNPPYFPKKRFFILGGGPNFNRLFFREKRKKCRREKKKNVIQLENHWFKCAIFVGAKNYVAIERKFGDPEMHPKSEDGVKIEGNVKKLVLIMY